MSIKQIVRYLELKSQLSPEDLAFAERIVSWTESEKETLAGLLQPVKSKSTKPATKRVIEKCARVISIGDDDSKTFCGLTRRAQVHKDSSLQGFHEFTQQPSSSKSKRASGIAATLGSRSRKPPQPAICVECGEINDHANHDVANGGHEFTTDLAGRVIGQLAKHEYCIAMVDDNGGQMECGKSVDDNVHHKQTDPDYHEFIASETAVGVGG